MDAPTSFFFHDGSASIAEGRGSRRTPLMLAAHAGARKTLSALLEAGADVSARDASRVTAL